MILDIVLVKQKKIVLETKKEKKMIENKRGAKCTYHCRNMSLSWTKLKWTTKKGKIQEPQFFGYDSRKDLL